MRIEEYAEKDYMNFGIPKLTEKMQSVYTDIIASLGQLPMGRKEYLFGADEEDLELVIAVANCITLEFIKYSYDYNDPEYSLRHFLTRADADDSERMLQSRTVQYVLKYKRKEIQENPSAIPPNHKFADNGMDTMSKKLKGYRFTEMNYFEHQKIHDLEIIKAIVEKRIVSSKKVSNQRFVEMFEQYDEMIEDLIVRSSTSDQEMVFCSLAFFNIEWHFAIEAIYYIACLMEERNIPNIDLDSLILLCGGVHVESRFGGVVTTDSRMVKERLFLLDSLLDDHLDAYLRPEMINWIKEIIVLIAQYKECVETEAGELYKEWFRQETMPSDWASFFRYYDLFSIWQKKEWTRKRVQNVRRLFDLIIKPKN